MTTRDIEKILAYRFEVAPEARLIVGALHGDPIPAPRVRVTRFGTYNPRKYSAYRDSLRVMIKQEFQQHRVDGFEHSRTDYAEVEQFGLKALFFRKGRHRTDTDNLLKTVCDAGTGVIWNDDSQVKEVYGRTFYADANPRVLVLVYELEETEEERDGRMGTCPRCNGAFRLQPGSKRKFCSDECRYPPRAPAICRQCGVTYTLPRSIQDRSRARSCSRACAVEYQRRNCKSRINPKGVCIDCGGPISKSTYTRCKACQLDGLRGKNPFPYAVVADEPQS